VTDAVLTLLTDKARFATSEQVAAVLGTPPEATARKLKALAKAGWLDSATVIVRRPKFTLPLMTEADPEAMAASVAWKLETRWGNARPKPARLWWATRRAARLCGGRYAGVRQPLQIEHDLLLLDALIRRQPANPGWEWVGEDDLRHRAREFGGKVPDAAVNDCDRMTVIEIGGQYSSERLKEFVTAMNRFRLAFEVW